MEAGTDDYRDQIEAWMDRVWTDHAKEMQ